MIPVKDNSTVQEQSGIHQLRIDLHEALLEAEAIRKGQQEGTTWQAFLAELDQESEEMEATNASQIHDFFRY